ncbi:MULTISPECIES: LysR family transcriptional regulator [unclassified Shewanella]|uniref:LysR family transcriptional regulator n=2 Tax=unclassified Shewanella TaxID=196818 RepID=UPI000C823E6E|nr:LysR family transcriptional regulator [Shewanella sp. 10N.286.51.B7]PMG75226.1 LysR family transcriptional regulator [Shewanella sp. 10N.286.51.B7]
MELRHLKHFLVVADLKHFHRAALELNLAQPSLSRSIQKMEDLLGAKLLERTSRSVTLTPFGEVVVEHGSRIVRDVEYLKREIKAIQGLETGELMVGASAIPLNSIVGPSIGQFINTFPNVNVELKVGNWLSLYQKLCKAEVSLFIAETKATELDLRDDIEVIPLPSFQAVFCCRAGHPLTDKPQVTLDDIKQYPIAIPSALPKPLFDQFGDLFSKYRDDFSGLVKFEQFQAIKESLTECDLVALAPDISIVREVESQSLVELPVMDIPDIKASFSIVYLKNRRLTPAAKAFIDFINPEPLAISVN